MIPSEQEFLCFRLAIPTLHGHQNLESGMTRGLQIFG